MPRRLIAKTSSYGYRMRPMHCLMYTLFLLLLLFAFGAFRNPKQTHPLQRQTSPCEPGGNPILYKEYREECPAKMKMNDQGECPTDRATLHSRIYCRPFCQWPRKTWCTSYCEVRQEFRYGQEVPLSQPYCHGPMTCTVGSNIAEQYTWSFSGNIDWLKPIVAGITGGFSASTTTTSTESKSISLTSNECGYFTFLPIIHTSCGTVSEGRFDDRPLDHCGRYRNTPNVCTDQPYRSGDGKLVLGDTVFVRTDCGNRQRLGMKYQDPAYRHEGVAQPQAMHDEFIAKMQPSRGRG